jgi:heptosyltransferase-2
VVGAFGGGLGAQIGAPLSAAPDLRASKVLCVAPHWVGDSLFFLPAVDALRRRFPEASFGLLAKAGIAGLLKGSGRFQQVHVLPTGAGRWERFLAHWRLRDEGYELAVVFPDSFSSAFAAFLSGAGLRVGRSGEGRSLLLSPGFRLPRRTRRTHVVDEYLALVEACGASAFSTERIPTLSPAAEGIEEQQRLFRERGLGKGLLIALCPTSAYGPAKRWPGEHWSALALELKRRRFNVVFLCAPSEWEGVEELARASGSPVLAPSLAGLAACLQACEAVVANDSGPLHLAAAVGARCLGLYGPVDPQWSGPRTSRGEALYLGLACSPCYARVCPLGHHDCLRTLSVERVLGELTQVLKR